MPVLSALGGIVAGVISSFLIVRAGDHGGGWATVAALAAGLAVLGVAQGVVGGPNFSFVWFTGAFLAAGVATVAVTARRRPPSGRR